MAEPHMARAIALAHQAQGLTSPNPPVGAVLVNDGRVVGQGFTRPAGQAHAEIVALGAAGARAAGATLYVTLEPCSHWGRTPPCTDALIAAGVRAVHVAMLDPNPNVNGAGKVRLEQHGIEVTLGECGEDAAELLEAHTKYITSRCPFVTLLLGAPEPMAAELERVTDSILTDRATDRRRHEQGDGLVRPPLRVIVSDRADPELLTDPRTIVALCPSSPVPPGVSVEGSQILRLPGREGEVDYAALFAALGKHEITSCLVTGSADLARTLLDRGLVDKIVAGPGERLPAGFVPVQRAAEGEGHVVLYPSESSGGTTQEEQSR